MRRNPIFILAAPFFTLFSYTNIIGKGLIFMKRVLKIFAILLGLDQVLKAYFHFSLSKQSLQWGQWGVTYKENNGTWLFPNASRASIMLLVAVCVIILFFAVYLYKFYTTYIRKGKLVDIIFALLLTGVTSNIFIDQMFLGYIRDYIINPIAISNLADVFINLSVILIIIESIVLYKGERGGRQSSGINSIKCYFRFIYNDIKGKFTKSK